MGCKYLASLAGLLRIFEILLAAAVAVCAFMTNSLRGVESDLMFAAGISSFTLNIIFLLSRLFGSDNKKILWLELVYTLLWSTFYLTVAGLMIDILQYITCFDFMWECEDDLKLYKAASYVGLCTGAIFFLDFVEKILTITTNSKKSKKKKSEHKSGHKSERKSRYKSDRESGHSSDDSSDRSSKNKY